MKDQYLAFVLTAESRARLLKEFPPKYRNVIAHHITIQREIDKRGLDMLNDSMSRYQLMVLAYGSDESVDCVIVAVNGSTLRMDGGHYHVTLSCSPTGKPVDSNLLINNAIRNPEKLDWCSERSIILNASIQLLDKSN